MKPLPPDHVIAKALSHPLRIRILAELDGGEASPVELARTLDADVALVSFHMRRLVDAGLVRPTRTRQVRGAVGRFYALAIRARIVAERA
jgi:DNA-binding transcriptional ArsR family regulator